MSFYIIFIEFPFQLQSNQKSMFHIFLMLCIQCIVHINVHLNIKIRYNSRDQRVTPSCVTIATNLQ